MQLSTTKMDKAAISLSLACVVHCLLTPIAIVMLPALGATFLEDERFHYAIIFLVVPTSLIALGLGCRRHGHREILLLGLVGLCILSLILIIEEETLGELGEKLSTVAGSVIISIAHVRNYLLCRNQECYSDEST